MLPWQSYLTIPKPDRQQSLGKIDIKGLKCLITENVPFRLIGKPRNRSCIPVSMLEIIYLGKTFNKYLAQLELSACGRLEYTTF